MEDMKSKAASDVQLYLQRQEHEFLKGLFEKFAESVQMIDISDTLVSQTSHSSSEEKQAAMLNSIGLQKALLELGVKMDADQVEKLIFSMDLDDNGGLDFEEFKRAAQQPATPLEQWVAMLPINGMLARSFPICGDQGYQTLRNVGRLGADDINAAVDVFSAALRHLLVEAQTKLRQMFKMVDERAAEAAKESVSAVSKYKTFKMRTGTVKDYVEGIAGRVGTRNRPSLRFEDHDRLNMLQSIHLF
jgi:hypothetical protein